MSEQHFRAAAGLAANFDGRTVEGLLVPYNKPQNVKAPGFHGREAYAPGVFDHQIPAANRIPLFLDHGPLGGRPIGRVDKLESRTDGKAPGLYGTAIVSDPTALALMKDGVYPDFSIGFNDMRTSTLGDGTIMRTKANMFELAVVREGAIKGAGIAAFRSGACPHCGHAVDLREEADPDGAAKLTLEMAKLNLSRGARW